MTLRPSHTSSHLISTNTAEASQAQAKSSSPLFYYRTASTYRLTDSSCHVSSTLNLEAMLQRRDMICRFRSLLLSIKKSIFIKSCGPFTRETY